MPVHIRLKPWLPVLIAAALPVPGFFLLSGCYTLKQGTAMLGYLGRAVPLEKLSAEGASEEDRLFAARVAGIRRFALEELGLRESKNYTRYVQIDRDYLAAVVSACAADSFTRHEWTFPVAGTVPYKGFFDPEDAKKEAAKLRAAGFDVWIRKVDAFSTLGWFRDPLYSYMKGYPEYELADLIIHELLHATVFVKGQVQFNEQLASFVGETGARLYVESRFGAGSPEYMRIDEAGAGRAVFRTITGSLTAELETLYADNSMVKERKLAEKERIIMAAQKRFEAEYETLFQNDDYRGFAKLPVNNAYLDLYRLYEEKDNFLGKLYEKTAALPAGADAGSQTARLRAFITAAASLSGSRAARNDPRAALTAAVTGY